MIFLSCSINISCNVLTLPDGERGTPMMKPQQLIGIGYFLGVGHWASSCAELPTGPILQYRKWSLSSLESWLQACRLVSMQSQCMQKASREVVQSKQWELSLIYTTFPVTFSSLFLSVMSLTSCLQIKQLETHNLEVLKAPQMKRATSQVATCPPEVNLDKKTHLVRPCGISMSSGSHNTT